MKGNAHTWPLCSVCYLDGSLKQGSAWAATCEFVAVLPFGYLIQRCCRYAVRSELQQMHQELKWNCQTFFFKWDTFQFPGPFVDPLGENMSFDGISSRLLCNWVGINPNAIYFYVSGSLSCTVQNT